MRAPKIRDFRGFDRMRSSGNFATQNPTTYAKNCRKSGRGYFFLNRILKGRNKKNLFHLADLEHLCAAVRALPLHTRSAISHLSLDSSLHLLFNPAFHTKAFYHEITSFIYKCDLLYLFNYQLS